MAFIYIDISIYEYKAELRLIYIIDYWMKIRKYLKIVFFFKDLRIV